MKKLLLFALAALTISFAGCKKNQPKELPDPTPQTGAQATTDDVTKGLDDALQAKDSNKLQELLGNFSAKLKDLKNPETLKVIKDQLPKVQEWLNQHKADVEKVLGDKASMVSSIADFKIPNLPI